MTTDWTPLRVILAQYRSQNAPLPLWWRDDDAVANTGALERLTALSNACDLTVHIAVIPGLAQPDLVTAVAQTRQLVPVIHGWRHENHASPNTKKSEFGHDRAGALQELKDGVARIRDLFGDKSLPLFVPPWNRIDPVFFAALTDAGVRGVSTFSPRTARLAAPGLVQINTHIDPIDWHGSRDLKDPAMLIDETADLLNRRLQGEVDQTEPFGYLTHHLIHSERLWAFSRQFLTELLDAGATPQPIAPLLETTDEPT
ncbi:MAG: polysaccharide deacetylase family protein [Pseudomonadota bacterium]